MGTSLTGDLFVRSGEKPASQVCTGTSAEDLGAPFGGDEDLEALEQRQATSMDDLRRSVEQVYDLSKWLIGGILLCMFALAVNTFIRRKEQ